MAMSFLVAVGVSPLRRLAEAGCAADPVFVFQPPARRPHEGFVIKSGGKKPVQKVVHRSDIEFQAGPTVLAGGDKAVTQLDPCRS